MKTNCTLCGAEPNAEAAVCHLARGDRSKAIYVACVVDGRSVSEVARMFGIPPNTVSQIKRRGMRCFQKIARPVA